MTFVTALVLTWGLASLPARAAEPPAQSRASSGEKARLKPVGLGGFQTESEQQRTTEEAPNELGNQIGALENLKENPYLSPAMKSQVQGLLQQTRDLEKTSGVDYSRPAGMGGAGANPRGIRQASPRAAPALDMHAIENRASPSNLSSPSDEPSTRSGTTAPGAPTVNTQPASYSSLREGGDAGLNIPVRYQAVWAGRAAAAQEAVSNRPSDSKALEGLARAELGQGHYNEAAEAANRAIGLRAVSGDAYMIRAMARERLGDRPGALADAFYAAQLDPTYHARAAAAAAGGSLFDPASAESWGLLEKMSPPPEPPQRGLWMFLLTLLSIGAAAAAGHAAWTLWKDMPAEQQRRLLGLWHKTAAGRALLALRSATPAPVTGRREMALKTGHRLGKKYDLIRPIGRDGTVEVWKAHDTTLDRDVLLKRLYCGPGSEELDLRRTEARHAAGLHHPNIVELYEIAELPEGLFAVFEYASGKSLRQVLKEKKSLSLRATRDILVPVCRALEHAHRRGLAHGGLSPERIVLTRQGYVKVMDFILARTMGAGSEAYAAPETKRGAPTPASDVYSIGVCLNEMLSGELPGASDWSPPPGFSELLNQSLDLDARTRLSSARAFLDALKKVPADTMPPRLIATQVAEEPPLTKEPDEESATAVESVLGSLDAEPAINPGPPSESDAPDSGPLRFS